MRRFGTVAVVLSVIALAAPMLVAHAASTGALPNAFTVHDPRDTKGPLDIESVTTGWRPAGNGYKQLMFGVTTFGHWKSPIFGLHNYNGIAIQYGLIGYESSYVVPIWIRGRFVAPIFTRRSIEGYARVLRPDTRSIVLVLPRVFLSSTEEDFRWRAFSSYRGGLCRRLCADEVPDKGFTVRDVQPPWAWITGYPTVSTDVSATTSFSVGFDAYDTGSRPSGLSRWRLQGRTAGSSWQVMSSGRRSGSQFGTVRGRPGHLLHVRLMATDREGNRTVSPSVVVAVPLDDADPTLHGAYSGEAGLSNDGTDWTAVDTGSTAKDYLQTLHVSSVPGATFTYRFAGPSEVVLVFDAATPFDGEITVCVNGSSCNTQEIGGGGPRTSEVRNAGRRSDTVTVTLEAGTVGFDGVAVLPPNA